VRRVLCFECGTLFPYCLVLPWKRPSWERRKGVEILESEARIGGVENMVEGAGPAVKKSARLGLSLGQKQSRDSSFQLYHTGTAFWFNI
jgi:hypothetical protein